MPVKVFLETYRWLMREAVAVRRLNTRRGDMPLPDSEARMRQQFETVVQLLPDVKAQTVIRLFYGCGDTDEAIADALDLSERHIKRLRAAALQCLKDRMPDIPMVK